MRVSDSLKSPVTFLSFLVLTLLVATFAEIQGFVQPFLSNSGKRELFFLELAFVVLTVLNRQVRFPRLVPLYSAQLILLGFWLVWSLFSAINGVFPVHALFKYAEHITLVLFAYALSALILSYDGAKKWVLQVALIGFFIYLIYLFFFYFMQEGYESEVPFALTFYEVGFSNIRYLAYYLLVGAILGSAAIADEGNGFGNFFSGIVWVCVVGAWALLFWAGGRGPVLAFAVSLAVLVYAQGGVRNSYRLLKVVSISMLIGAVLSFIIPGSYGLLYLLDRLIWWDTGKDAVIFAEQLRMISNSRITMWLACVDDITANPWFGIGQNSFTYSCGKEFYSKQPHGIHVQALLDWGWPGALAFFLFIAGVLRRGFRQVKAVGGQSFIQTGAFWALQALVISSFYDGIFVLHFSLMFIVLFMVLILISMDGWQSGSDNDNGARRLVGFMLIFVVGILIYAAFNNYPLVIETSAF